MEATTLQLRGIFRDVQASKKHRDDAKIQLTVGLLSRYENVAAFKKILSTLLLAQMQEIPASMLDFLREIISELRKRDGCLDILSELYRFLLPMINCSSRKARRNVLVLLQLLEVDENDLGKLSEKLFDKNKSTRKECVKLLKPYQEFSLNPKTTIIGLFKDLLRYDPSPDVRREVLKSMYVDKRFYTYIVSRCEDTNVLVRKAFYSEVLESIVLRDLVKDKRVLLLKKAFSEREFDAKECLQRKCAKEYANDLKQLAEDFYDEDALVHLDALLKYYFPSSRLVFNSYYLENISLATSHLLLEYLKFVEGELGRESLEMVSLNIYLEFLYRICCESLEDREKVPVASNLFRILDFYEVLEEGSQKVIRGTIYKMLGKNFVEEIIDEVIMLSSISSDILFIGTLIKKNMKSENALLLCKSVMKNVRPFSELHSAILGEIVSKHKNEQRSPVIFEILFFYCLENPEAEYLSLLVNNITETFMLLVDLYLSKNENADLKQVLFVYMKEQISNESIAIPASKIMLFDGTDTFLENIVGIYYRTKDNEIKQYLTVFFREYFGKFGDVLVSRFCSVLTYLTSSHKLWVDQSIYWLQNSTAPDISKFVYNILVFMCRNQDKHQKLLTSIFEHLELTGGDPVLIKKIIYCCTLLLRKGINVSVLIGKAMVVDNGEPIEKAVLENLKSDIGMDPC